MSQISLKEMMEYAIEHDYDIDRVLDMWNSDPDKLREFYKSRDRLRIDGDVLQILNDSVKTIEKMKQRDKAIVKNMINSLQNDVNFNYTDEGLVVSVKVFTDWDDHEEITELIFGHDVDKDDEGVLNAVDATLSELSYYYLLNM